MTTGAEAKQASWLVEDMLAEQQRMRQVADQMAAGAQAEAQRMKEAALKLPLPESLTEGKYEARIVQALVEILTGRPTRARPQKIMMPETIFESIVLELSSTEQFYYRVTPGHCTCKGWFYSMERFGIGKCRHHTDAFPEIAARNHSEIERIKAEKKATKVPASPKAPAKAAKPKPKVRSEEPRELTPQELEDLNAKVTAALKGKYPLFSNVSSSGMNSLNVRVSFKDDYTAAENAQMQEMRAAAKAAAPGMEISISSM